jgi:hypothetical protein
MLKHIRNISHAEFEYEFLKGEFYKNTFRHIQKDCGKIVKTFDKYNVADNDLRSLLLKIERGTILKHLPNEIKWSMCEIGVKDLMNASVINEASWKYVFGSKRKACEIADLIEDGIYNEHVGKIEQIVNARKISNLTTAKFILLRNNKGALSIIEGNHRAVALVRMHKNAEHEYNPVGIAKLFPLQVVIGDIGKKKCVWA